MTRPLDVLVVAPHAVLGGQESWLLQLLDATTRLHVEAVLLQDGPLRHEFERRGIAVQVLPVGPRPRDLARPVLRLTSRLRDNRPDIVLANGVKAQFVAGPAARLAGVHCAFVRHDHALERFVPGLARLADVVIGTTPQVLAAVGRPDATVVFPPRPTAPALARADARGTLSEQGVTFRDDRLTLVMATRLVPYKGVDDAITALAQDEAASWELVVLGGADPSAPGEAARLDALAQSLGVRDHVQIVGYVPEAARLLSAFDALAVLTKPAQRRDPGREGFGMTVLEAMIAGVPVIAVGGGDIEDRLGGEAGIAVPPADPSAVAAALGRLRERATREVCAAAAFSRAADHPSSQQSADLLCGLLSAAARRPGAGSRSDEPVSVVVPVYDEGLGVDAIVSAVLAQLQPADELIVVDDASNDDTPQRLADLAARTGQLLAVRQPVNGGPSRARNAGVRTATHELIVCTDAGNDLPDGWIDAMRCALADNPPAQLVTGAYRVSEEGPLQQAMSAALYPGIEETRHPGPLVRAYGRIFGRTFDAARPAGRAVAFRRRAWRSAGGFPEHLRTGEDVTFGLAVAGSGDRCVLQTDEPPVWRQHSTLRGTARMYYSYGYGDGMHGEGVAVFRNAVRALAALSAPLLLARAGTALRTLVLSGAIGYLSLPMVILRRRGGGAAAYPLVPVVLAVKDLSKAAGCYAGLVRTQRQERLP